MKINDLIAVSQFGTTGWEYGKRTVAPAAGFMPTREMAGFPKGGGFGSGKFAMPKMSVPKAPRTPLGSGTAVGKPFRPAAPKVAVKPVAPKTFAPKINVAKPTIPKPAMSPKPPSVKMPGVTKKLSGTSEDIEDMEGMGDDAIGHAHIDPMLWFRPPSLVKREKGTAAQNRIPVDQPGETNNRFLDVTKRDSKDTQDYRMGLLKRKAPAGAPPQIPVRTTLVAPHSGSYLPGMESAGYRMNRQKRRSGRGMYTDYGRRGCI